MPFTTNLNGPLGLKQLLSSDASTHSKPTFILVHGAWQASWIWTYTIPLLERAGYATYPVTLVSPGSEPPVLDFSADVEVVRRVVDSILESGKDAILVLFSYGGLVGCEALKSFHDEHHSSPETRTGQPSSTGKTMEDRLANAGFPRWFTEPRRGKVLHIAFIASYIVPAGMNLWRPEKGDSLPGISNVDGILYIRDGADRFFDDLPRPIAEYWARRLKCHPIKAFYSKLTYPAYLYYPTSYLTCIADKSLPHKVQERMIKLANIKPERVARVKAGHMVMISQPMAVAKFLRQAAGETFSVL